MNVRKYLFNAGLCALAMACAAPLTRAAAAPVVMRLLVLATTSSDQSYQSISTYLKQIGVPFDSVVLNNQTADSAGNRLSGLVLSNTATGEGLYQGIIETSSTFNVCNPTCRSLMSTTDWSKLGTYAAQFGVRVATYFTSPDAKWGLLPADSGVTYTAANPLNVSLTSAGAAVFSYLNPATPIPVAGNSTATIVAYRATATAAANETTTPLLTAGSFVVGATHTTADGRETLSLTFDNSPTLLHSLAFNYGVINWVTRGVFLGSRKMYLNTETDDMLLGNALYAPSLSTCQQTDTCPTVYTTAQDLTALVNWQNNLHANPQFQTFHNTFAYNGGATTWRDLSDPVFSAIPVLSSNFGWMSHTWSHPNLDCYTTTANGVCQPANLSQSLSQLTQNVAIAPTLGFTIDSTGLVTPYNGGLTDLSFLQAAAQVGIRYIITTDNPLSPMTGNVSPLLSSILLVTRRDPNLFYDVNSPLTGVFGSWPDEYNAMFGPKGTNPTYSTNQTYSQILNNESDSILRNNLLSYEPYPLAFHISNTSNYDGTHSLYTDLMDATIAKYNQICTLPVLTLDMKDIGPLLANRASYNGSGVVGVYTPGVSVVLTTQKAAPIPITGACSQSTCGTYGGQMQDSVVMAANSTVTLSLSAGQGVAVASVSLNPTNVTGGSSSTGTITLSGPAPAGGISVALSSNSPAATVPVSVPVSSGSSTATFTVQTTAVSSSATAGITASYNGASKTAALTIAPAVTVALSSVSVSPVSVTGGSSATGTVTLSAAAPTGGVTVTLKSSSTSATVPASVTVAAGASIATFSIATQAVTASTAATITGTYNSISQTASLTITPAVTVALSSVSVSPVSVTGGSSATGTVTLSAAAPTGGVTVTLKSSSTSATVPASVTVAAGASTATFSIATKAVTASTTATITGTYNSVSKTASLTITKSTTVALSSVSVSPTTVTAGISATGTVTLSAAAPTGGISVDLWTTGTVAFVPTSITIPAGSTTGTFTVTTINGASGSLDTITAFYNGTTKTAKITVNALLVSSVSVNPATVTGGNTATGTVTLTVAAPAGGVSIDLWTTGTVAFVPVSITIPAGSTTGTFTVTTNGTSSTLQDTITAFYYGVSKTAKITVNP